MPYTFIFYRSTTSVLLSQLTQDLIMWTIMETVASAKPGFSIGGVLSCSTLCLSNTTVYITFYCIFKDSFTLSCPRCCGNVEYSLRNRTYRTACPQFKGATTGRVGGRGSGSPKIWSDHPNFWWRAWLPLRNRLQTTKLNIPSVFCSVQ